MTDQQQAPDPSQRVIAGRYRLEASIGRGAMGTVWSSTDELLHRSVAVKELKLSSDVLEEEAAELRERALREARAMAGLAHPNVVLLYDVAWENNSPFVIMELVAARSLGKILDVYGRLNQQQLALLANDVAAALQAAHRIGVTHRDVKPGNVLFSLDGRVKLSDFGIARNSADSTITKTGYLMGSPAFIAPELAVGDVVTTSADLWSLGTMLYRAAEGHLPYDSNTDPLITVSSIINGKVPRHHQTGPIGEVISGLMVKDPTRRIPLDQVRRIVRHMLPEPGTTPFAHLLDHNAPEPLASADPPVRPAGAGPPSRSDAQPAPAPPPPPNPPMPNGPTLSSPEIRRKRWVSPAVVGLAAPVLIVLGTIGFLLSDGPQDGQAGMSVDEHSIAPSDPTESNTQSSVARPSIDHRSAYDEIEAETYEGNRPAEHYTHGKTDSTDFIGLSTSDDNIVYRNVDFGSAPAQKLSLMLAPGREPVNRALEIRLDDPHSTPIGELVITSKRGSNNWKWVSVQTLPVSGKHDVYLNATVDKPGTAALVYLDSFTFHR